MDIRLAVLFRRHQGGAGKGRSPTPSETISATLSYDGREQARHRRRSRAAGPKGMGAARILFRSTAETAAALAALR